MSILRVMVLLALVAALWFAALVATRCRVSIAIHAASRRLTVSAAMTGSLVMPATTTTVLLGLFHLHLEVCRQKRLLRGE